MQPHLPDRWAANQLRVTEDIVLDLDADGQLIGIELLNASSLLLDMSEAGDPHLRSD